MNQKILDEINEHQKLIKSSLNILASEIEIVSDTIIETFSNNGRLYIFGNGGSAADAQHIAAEMIGRYKLNRKSLPAIALTTDSSAITAIANDFSYDDIFQRQVYGLATKKDIVFGISTSGNSTNVIKGLIAGKEIGCKVIGLTGSNGGEMKKRCDNCIMIPSGNTPRIQELHILVGHIICDIVDNYFFKNS